MNNPYSAPGAVLSERIDADEFYQPKFFSLHGRIGRLRYLMYSFVATWVLLMVLGILAAILLPMFARGPMGGAVAVAAIVLLYIPVIALSFIMAKRRLNDLDHSGWLSLLFLVPLANLILALYLIFGPGSATSNKYGPPPNKNPGVMLFGVIGVLVIPMVIGILAAIAIPQYQQYVNRAKNKAAQQAQQAPSESEAASASDAPAAAEPAEQEKEK